MSKYYYIGADGILCELQGAFVIMSIFLLVVSNSLKLKGMYKWLHRQKMCFEQIIQHSPQQSFLRQLSRKML